MTYPASSDVSAAQPTASAHYNNLRSDALFLGQISTNAAPLGTLLQNYQDNLNLVYLATNRVRCVATAASPVSVVVAGYMCVAVANVDLATAPSGVAAIWYIFANRTAGSTTFTLSVNTSSAVGADQRLIGQCYWDGSSLIRDSIRLNIRTWMMNTLKTVSTPGCCGRLTVASGDPVPYATTSSGTVFFTPYGGM
jgi:hypothetical protein